MAVSSRLVQYERRQALRSALLYIVLTAAILYGLSRFGTQLITSVTGVVTDGKGTAQSDNDSVVPPPQINTLPEVTNQKTITAEGTAPSGETVRLTLNGSKQDIVSTAQGVWTIPFELHEGENTIKAQVVDSRGNTSQEVSSVISLDTVVPTLTIATPEEGASKSGKKEQSLLIEGITDQDAAVKVNDRIAIVNGQGGFSVQMSLTNGENEFTIIATDRAGNTTQEVRHITFSE